MSLILFQVSGFKFQVEMRVEQLWYFTARDAKIKTAMSAKLYVLKLVYKNFAPLRLCAINKRAILKRKLSELSVKSLRSLRLNFLMVLILFQVSGFKFQIEMRVEQLWYFTAEIAKIKTAMSAKLYVLKLVYKNFAPLRFCAINKRAILKRKLSELSVKSLRSLRLNFCYFHFKPETKKLEI
jgi:hypothetical protein